MSFPALDGTVESNFLCFNCFDFDQKKVRMFGVLWNKDYVANQYSTG